MRRQHISTGGPWESKIGYSRAVRVGAHVSVSGSTAMTSSGLIGKGDPYAQTIQALKTVESALQQAGISLADVVRTRIYLTNIDQCRRSDERTGKSSGLSDLPRRWSK